MPALFSDTFSGYSPGASPFDGWSNIDGGGGVIVDFSTYAGGHFAGQTGHGCNIYGGEILWGGPAETSVIPNSTVVWSGLGHNQGQSILGPSMYIGITTDTTQGFQIAGLVIEPDETISLYAGAPFVGTFASFANTVTQLYHPDTWQTWQVAWQASSAQVITGTGSGAGTNYFIAVTASVWLEGTLIINGAYTVTNVQIGTSTGMAPSAGINEYFFGAYIGGQQYLSEIWATDSALGTATFPFLGTGTSTSNVRMTQQVMEYARTAPPRNVRMTQGVVEMIQYPAQRNVRMTQGVVEIIKKGGLPSGWVVQEV
jgi:hypothetical protein